MTKKDYEAIAYAINYGQLVRPPVKSQAGSDYMTGAQDQRYEIAIRLAAHMENNNPRFDRARFLKACGIE